MTKQKQSRVDLLENKVKAMIGVLQRILEESAYLKDISVGTLQLVKKMPDYDKALQDLALEAEKEKAEAEVEETEKKLEL
jgi:hypothetical protein